MRNLKQTEEKSTKPTAEERETFAAYRRTYSRGNSNPRLIDIARAGDEASVLNVIRAFVVD